MIDLNGVIKRLRLERPIFHSEADFQHSLAWQIHTEWPSHRIRLEMPFKDTHVDIVVGSGDQQLAIELKYKTRAISVEHQGEAFDLKNQGAQDLYRYDFLLDVQKLERFVKVHGKAEGCAVMLTNDSSYWSLPRHEATIYESFRIHEGRRATGNLAWGVAASKGTTKGREETLTLSGTYEFAWQDYSQVHDDGNDHDVPDHNLFRYLIANVR